MWLLIFDADMPPPHDAIASSSIDTFLLAHKFFENKKRNKCSTYQITDRLLLEGLFIEHIHRHWKFELDLIRLIRPHPTLISAMCPLTVSLA